MNANKSIQTGLKQLYIKGMSSAPDGEYTRFKGLEKALNNYNQDNEKGKNYSTRVLGNKKALDNGTKVSF